MSACPDRPLTDLPAAALAALLRRGELTATRALECFIDRFQEAEPQVHAWTGFDHESARAQARALDALRASGTPPGPLHGVPLGIKDIFDTADFPTECGSAARRGRRPVTDATVVTRLRRAGAVIPGKTVTTEFALYQPGRTRNPRDTARTPGGSSSGSAAAVGAGMVPAALGTQTNGSVIRPASFCGVVGFVPTFGTVPRSGVFQVSAFLDRVGVFTRCVHDAALLVDVLAGQDGIDGDTLPAPPSLVAGLDAGTGRAPRLAWVRTPFWQRAADSVRRDIEALAGTDMEELVLPGRCIDAWEWHHRIMCADLAGALRGEFETRRELLGDRTREAIEFGRGVSADELARLRDDTRSLRAEMDRMFAGLDAVLTPAATDVAPLGLDYTGDPVFCSLWSLLGLPSISLPLLSGTGGLPVGVQLVGRRGADAALLRAARWLETRAPAQA